MISGLSWGGFLVVGLGLAATGVLAVGLGMFVRDEILDTEDPEDRWARDGESQR